MADDWGLSEIGGFGGEISTPRLAPEKRSLPHAAPVNWFEDGKLPTRPKQFYLSTFFFDKALEYLRAGAASGKYKGRYDAGWTALR